MNQKQKIFRQESLARLSSPERLDQLMQVVAPRDWLVLATLGSLVAVAVGWSVWGRVPLSVEGRGVLLYPYRTTEFQSPISGQLIGLRLKPGDRVQKGEVIGTIDQPDLHQELAQQTQKLQRLQQQNQQLTTLNDQQFVTEQRTLRRQRQTLQQTLKDKQAFLYPVYTKAQLTLQKQRQALEQTLRDKQAIAPILQQQVDDRRQLQAEGAISTDLVLQATQAYQDNLQQISTIQAQLQSLQQQALTLDQTYRTSLGQLNNLNTQIQVIQTQEQQLLQRSLTAKNDRTNQIQEVKQKIAQITLQLKNKGHITSQYSGRILEISVKPGQVIRQGDRIGLVETDGHSQQLTSLLYFPIKAGKRIQPGMTLQITPDSVQRERFGGILGTVKSVSIFPVSRQTILNAIGSTEITDSLMFPGGQVEVLAELKPDPNTATGYQWSSSRGPEMPLSPGTTASVRVTVEQRAPITFVLPILRSFTNTH